MFARLDFSMVDLLDILSPVSAPKQSKPSARRPETSQHRSALKTPGPVSRTVLTPARSYLHHTLEDPEESQILEDIFFICWQRRQTKNKTENRSELLDIYLFGLTFFSLYCFYWHFKPDLPWCHSLYCTSAVLFFFKQINYYLFKISFLCCFHLKEYDWALHISEWYGLSRWMALTSTSVWPIFTSMPSMTQHSNPLF